MNYLTTSNILRVSNNILKNSTLHPTSIAYIRSLISPFAEVISGAITVQSIIEWIPQVLPGLISIEEINNDMKELNKIKGGITEGPDFVQIAISSVIKQLIIKLLAGLEFDVKFHKGDNIILPWDIQDHTYNNPVLQEKLGIVRFNDKLPVRINIDRNIYDHQFNEEFTMGLLLYSLVAQKPFKIIMFDVDLSNDYFLNPQGNRYTKFCSNARRTEFSVIISNVTYCFLSASFIQGFSTGASWYNEDHHIYWSNLISYEMNSKGVHVNF